MANWDEDTVTMAVEAARDCLAGEERGHVDAICLGSTSFPFLDRQNAGIVSDALSLGSELMTLDVGMSQRAGTTALLSALRMGGRSLVVGSENHRTKPGSSQELTSGDAAAAFIVGEGAGLARFIGGVSHAVDFVDHYRGEGEDFDYTWEERWVRDEGYLKIVPKAVKQVLGEADLAAGDVSIFCMPTASEKIAASVAKSIGSSQDALADNLQGTCGFAGAAHPLVLLSHALERAKPGDILLVVGFGQGCDALLFQATEDIAKPSARRGVSGSLAQRSVEENYQKFLAFNGLLDFDQGIRSEADKNTGLTTHYRNKAMSQGMIGGKCTTCGTSQFPKSRICANPECGEVDSQVDEPFAEKAAVLNSYTADALTYSPNPPNYYGMVQFEGGGRLMSDLTDVTSETSLSVGTPIRMVFRVKDHDRARGFRRYFWKATPA